MALERPLKTNRVDWRPCWRIIPGRFPPIDIFERVANPTDLEAVIALEAMTDDRVRDEVGALHLVPPEDRISGPGSSLIMAAFTHPGPAGSRFSDGTWGVYYAADTLDTAVAETKHHRAEFMRATEEPAMELQMQVIAADITGDLHDLRGFGAAHPHLYDPDDYSAPQALARSLREAGSNGVAYDSVRHATSECVGVFRPRLLSDARQERHLGYRWDGDNISDVYELGEYRGEA